MNAQPHTTIELLAFAIHESCRASVAAGKTLAHAVAPDKVVGFKEWHELPPEARAGKRLTAENFLRRFEVGRCGIDLEVSQPVYAIDVARAIHESEAEAVRHGLAIVKLDRPWTEYDDLPELAREGRLMQGQFIAERFALIPRQGRLL